MNVKCLAVTDFLLAVILAGVYKFIIQGSVIESEDGRVAIKLTDSEKTWC